MDELAALLRGRRNEAGAPSYQRIADRVGEVRAERGVRAADRTPGRITVYDCFRDGRKRVDAELVQDIVRALGGDEDEVRRWRGWCTTLGGHSVQSAVVTARRGELDDAGDFTARTAELRAANAHARTLIAGMPGAGKTRLAMRSLTERLDAGAVTDVITVDARGSDGPPAHPQAILDAIERVAGFAVGESLSVEDRATKVAGELAEARIGLLLDDVGTIGQVEALVRAAQTPVILTSRTTLDVPRGVQVLELRTWDTADTVAMLAERIGADRVAAEPEAAAEIAELTGGLPLAAALTAARIAARGSWTLAEHRDALRSRTEGLRLDDLVREAIALAVRARSEDEQRALRLLAIQPCDHLSDVQFAALVELDAGAATSLADALARANCAQRPGPGRIGLHALVRTFAAAQSWDEDPQGTRDRAVDRLADTFMWEAWSAAEAAYPGAVNRSRDTERAVATWDSETGLAWMREEIGNLSAVSRAVSERRPDYPPTISEALGRFLFEQGLLYFALGLHTENMAVAERSDDDGAIAVTALALGNVQARTGDSVSGRRSLQRAHDTAVRAGLARIELASLNNLAADAAARGDVGEAVEMFRATRIACERAGFHDFVASAIDNLAIMLRRSGDLTGAVAHHREAFEVAMASNNIVQAAGTMANLADPLLELGLVDEAIEAAREGMRLSEGISDATYSLAVSNLAGILREHGDLGEAMRLQQEAADRAAASGNAFQRSTTQIELGITHDTMGDRDAAVACWLEALEVSTRAELELERARALTMLARVDAERGDVDAARVRVTNALKAFGDTETAHVAEARALLAELSPNPAS